MLIAAHYFTFLCYTSMCSKNLFGLKFNPTNHFYVRTTTEKRHAIKAVYTVQNIVYSVQVRRGGGYLEIRSI